MNVAEGQNLVRLRVVSCHRVIHDVSRRLAGEAVHPRILEQLKRLDKLLGLIDHRSVNHDDMTRIEGSTNQLMDELSLIFLHQHLGPLYNEQLH